jgi:hypothetical protein
MEKIHTCWITYRLTEFWFYDVKWLKVLQQFLGIRGRAWDLKLSILYISLNVTSRNDAISWLWVLWRQIRKIIITAITVDSKDITAQVSGEQKHNFHFTFHCTVILLTYPELSKTPRTCTFKICFFNTFNSFTSKRINFAMHVNTWKLKLRSQHRALSMQQRELNITFEFFVCSNQPPICTCMETFKALGGRCNWHFLFYTFFVYFLRQQTQFTECPLPINVCHFWRRVVFCFSQFFRHFFRKTAEFTEFLCLALFLFSRSRQKNKSKRDVINILQKSLFSWRFPHFWTWLGQK